MADTTEAIQQQLDALALHLHHQREAILQAWRTATERAPEVTTASALTRTQFNDHIPQILDALERRLRLWPDAESDAAYRDAQLQQAEHGVQRWQQGYQLPELISEWGHLQSQLIEAFDAYALAHPNLEPLVMSSARRVLMRLSTASIYHSAAQYWQLHQTEASGHVRDLQEALTTLSGLEQLRSRLWHEAAHDLRGGLSVVQGASSELESEDISAATRTAFSVLLQKGVRSLQEILTDLMSLARLDAGQESRQVEDFDAAELLREFCETSLPLAHKRGLSFDMEGPHGLHVQGDRAKILRILQNLLLNSLKYTKRGGIKVVWGKSPEPSAQTWFFCVQDTGPGFLAGTDSPLAQQLYVATQSRHELEDAVQGPEHAERAPTLPAHSSGASPLHQPGEGVGLSIVKRLCDLLDASLELETRAGRGTTFRVIIPCRYVGATVAVSA